MSIENKNTVKAFITRPTNNVTTIDHDKAMQSMIPDDNKLDRKKSHKVLVSQNDLDMGQTGVKQNGNSKSFQRHSIAPIQNEYQVNLSDPIAGLTTEELNNEKRMLEKIQAQNQIAFQKMKEFQLKARKNL